MRVDLLLARTLLRELTTPQAQDPMRRKRRITLNGSTTKMRTLKSNGVDKEANGMVGFTNIAACIKLHYILM